MLRLIKIALLTLSMYLITHLYVFIVLPVVIIISYIDKKRIPALKKWFVKGLFGIVGKKLEISGSENINKDDNYLIISNYPSFYAGFALMGIFPTAHVIAHAFIRKIPLLGHALNRIGVIFVQPSSGGKGKKALDLGLQEREKMPSIIIFPEGKRTPDGNFLRFRRGFIYILRQTSLDLLPVTLNGFYQLKPVNRFHLDPDAEPEIIIHEPISNSYLVNLSNSEVLDMVQSIIEYAYQP